MTYTEMLNYIHSLGKFSLPAGLNRIAEVCKKLNNPQNSFKSIHIAGTNGKGSTAVLTANALKNEGLKVGLFISPFIIDFRERIEINGEYISQNDIVKYGEIVKNTGVALNEFEFICAVSFLYFKDEKIDVAVYETGLGGKIDATNIIDNVDVSVITKIGLDHTALLGETVEQIAAEKSGIIKKNEPVITVCNQDERALSVIRKHTDNLIVPETPEIQKSDITGSIFTYKQKKYELSLLGVHQCYNAVTVIEILNNSSFDVSMESIKKSFAKTSFPARLETVSKNPLTVIDGAHNPDGAKVLAKFLEDFGEKVTVICAMMRDKNWQEYVEIISRYSKTFIATEIDMNRCLSANELGNFAEKYAEKVLIEKDLFAAIKTANNLKSPIFIVGSLYLGANARKYYKK
ncbi:MAG: bifunctional folylpolyglutamate synthase/dihydrofolate synthase [Clostridia bacterium]|nr:bifunctional folylpolyglutamate synthase/dihydrofolate synthase [Clostridia bacterium]